jgi:hypothetical protein
MITLFANTFKSSYYEHLMGSLSKHFYDFVHITERIEQGIINYLNDYIWMLYILGHFHSR